MKFSTYQRKALETAQYPAQGSPIGLMYAGLGVGGEGGEVMDHIKKMWRSGGKLTDERREDIKDELGDLLWYAAQVATEAGLDLDEVAVQNNRKLRERAEKDEIKHHA